MSDSSINTYEENRISGFFYIKGSNDYPLGHLISQPFGFNSTDSSETPIFNSSIKDVYANKPKIIEVFNNYSLRCGDASQGIVANNLNSHNTGIADDLYNARGNGEKEYIDTLLIDMNYGSGVSNENFIQSISPNYTLPQFGANDSTFGAYVKNTLKPCLVACGDCNEYNPNGLTQGFELKNNVDTTRFNLFIQEVFRFIERLKKDESEICRLAGEPTYIPSFIDNGLRTWLGQNEERISEIKNIFYNGGSPGILPWLYMMYPPKEDPIYPDNYKYNPLRLAYENITYPTNVETTEDLGTGITEPDGQTDIAKIQDAIVGIPRNYHTSNEVPDNDPIQVMKSSWADLDIRIEKFDGNYSTVKIDTINNRVISVKFALSFRLSTSSEVNTRNDLVEKNRCRWVFEIFFNPDDFIASSDSNSILNVWTYNDLNIDNDMRQAQGGVTYPVDPNGNFVSTFNIYDNDYANVLVPPSNNVNSINRKFILGKLYNSSNGIKTDEMQTQVIDKIIEQTRNGNPNYVKFTTTRISPYIDEETNSVIWKPENSYEQEFYIFYNKKTPSTTQQIASVRSYLEKLHSRCVETAYDDQGKIKTIGHGQGADLTNFLANMYPNLFKKSEIIIVPEKYDHCAIITGGNGQEIASSYFSTVTPKKMFDSINDTVSINGTQFILDPSGDSSIIASSENQTCKWPVEAFHIGSLSNANNMTGLAFPMPWYAISPSSVPSNPAKGPLTSLIGFESFGPKFFINGVDENSSNADILQAILIRLALQMFTHVGHAPQGNANHKPIYSNMYGVAISYSMDNTHDEGLYDSVNEITYYNKAEFTLGGVSYTVYSQYGKDFCSSRSLPPEQENHS